MSWLKKGNTELLNEINYAIDQMNAVEGDWKTTLYNKNYESIETKNLEYTKKEKSIISQYSKDNPLHVLCDPTRYPYSYNENGEMKGIIPDYFRKIADYAGISYEFLTPATRDEYIAYQKIRILQILASMHAWKQITMLRRKNGGLLHLSLQCSWQG